MNLREQLLDQLKSGIGKSVHRSKCVRGVGNSPEENATVQIIDNQITIMQCLEFILEGPHEEEV